MYTHSTHTHIRAHTYPYTHTRAHTSTPGKHPHLPTHPYTCILYLHTQLHTLTTPYIHTPRTDIHALTCMHSIPAPLHTPAHTHMPAHALPHAPCMFTPTARTLVVLEDSALGLMLGLCPTFLKILWSLADGPRSSVGCLRSPLLLTPPPGQGSWVQAQACGIDSSLTSPVTGADHHHVRVGQPQRLCGAWLSLRAQAAHHPVPATEERG